MTDVEPAADLPARRSDGEATHGRILDAALRLASIEGLGSLTIGRLAKELNISKSGVFAHFRSRERLQRETIAAARQIYQREVLEPGLAAPAGLAQVEALCEAYLSYVERGVFPGGCFFAQVLAEFDAPDGAIHEEVQADQRSWIELLESMIETAKTQDELDRATETRQLAFDLYAPLELANYLSTLYRDRSFVGRGRTAVREVLARASTRQSRTTEA